MSESGISNFFGNLATQTADTVTFSKTELPFTAKPDNNGEQIFAAIVKRARNGMSVGRFEGNPDQNITLEDGLTERAYRTENGLEVPYLKTQVIVSFYKRDEALSAGIFPDDY